MSLRTAAAARVTHVVACAVAPLLASACGEEPRSPRGAGEPHFVLHDEPSASEFGAVDVTGLDDAAFDALWTFASDDPRWDDVFTVRNRGARHPVAGRYHVLEDRVRFTPRFPPVPGQPYEITFTAPGGESFDTVIVVLRGGDSPATRITAVWPGVDTVPMNLLRVYIAFSSPMSEGEAYDRIRLLDASGDTVPDAFLVLEHELWDRERTRFTLLFDPGRIKRGLVPNEELGLPLREGNDYTLVIDGGWTDGHGRPLADGHAWSFHAGPADRTSPRVEEWKVVSPSDGTREAVVIEAGEPLDQALLERLISVRGPRGTSIEGDVSVSGGGERWSFIPAEPWSAGEYTLEVGTALEDLAGNNLRHLFDVDRSDRQDTGVEGDVVRIPLVVRDD